MLLYKRCSCSSNAEHTLPVTEDLSSLEKTFSAISSQARLNLLLLLSVQPHCVCDLESHTGISQSLVSQYLAILENAALVQKERNGKFTEYSLTQKGKDVILAIQLITHSQ